MRAFKKYTRGFTLVELMIVVAIIGVLAALAIYGVRRYLQSAKTSEAKQSVGAITRGAIGAYERETTSNELLSEGAQSSAFSHNICGGATASVPTALSAVQGKKYQPNSTVGSDFDAGNGLSGWKCLKYTMTSPIYFRYGYEAFPVGGAAGGAAHGGTLTYGASSGEMLIWANGDLDGDTTPSAFGQNGLINTTSRTVKTSTQVQIFEEFE